MTQAIRLPQASHGACTTLRVPGDKSVSHRALIFGALACGTSQVTNLLEADDVASTERVLGQLGVRIDRAADGTRTIFGRAGQFTAPTEPLDCGNAGTCLRLMAGALVATNTPAVLTGDASLCGRPMGRLIAGLRQLGANVASHNETPKGPCAPLEVGRRGQLVAAAMALPVPSAQLATAYLLAALGAEGTLALSGLGGARDHSGRLLRAMGVQFAGDIYVGDAIAVRAGQKLAAIDVQVPGDLSSAAFWLAAAAIVPGSDVRIEGVSLNPSRLAFVGLLERMGARVTLTPAATPPSGLDEPTGSIRLVSGPLRAIALTAAEAAGLIDELPLVAAIASYAAGTTVVRGAAELRSKESDRIAAMASELAKLGAAIQTRPDGFLVTGPTPLAARAHQTLAAHGDHRVAMALAVASLGATGPVELQGAEVAAISYRGFWPAWQHTFGGA